MIRLQFLVPEGLASTMSMYSSDTKPHEFEIRQSTWPMVSSEHQHPWHFHVLISESSSDEHGSGVVLACQGMGVARCLGVVCFAQGSVQFLHTDHMQLFAF
jgi:hypothetical protein